MAKKRKSQIAKKPAEPDRSGRFVPMRQTEPDSDEYVHQLREHEAAFPRMLARHLEEWPELAHDDDADNTPKTDNTNNRDAQ